LAFLRNLAKVNSLKASFLFEQGKQKEAFDQSLKTIKMAQMLQDGQNGAIGYLIGLATKEIGLANLRSLIKDSNLSSVELLSFENELNKYKESKLAMQQVLKGEYMVSISSFEEIEKGFRGEASLLDDEQLKNLPSFVVRSFYFYKPNQTKLLNINITQRQLNNANKKSLSEVNKIEYKEPNYWTIVFTENAIGKILSNIREVSFESLYAKRFEENFSVKATQLLLALKAYKQDTGNLPNSLQNLVPNYILELIQDPFDGKSIKYSSDKKEIYSTGKDLIDNGGNISESDWKQGDDLGFKIDF